MSKKLRALGALSAVVALSGVALWQAPTASAAMTLGGKSVPDPLQLKSGQMVTSPAVWESTRRKELLADFQTNVYGTSMPLPTQETFAVDTRDSGTITTKIVTINMTGTSGSGSFKLKVFIPKDEKPVGTFLLIDHRGQVGEDPAQSSDYLPVTKLAAAGYASASFNAQEVAPDSTDYASKAMTMFSNPGTGKAISAWAWGASRSMDYLQKDPALNPSAIAVVGHSRSGKASLWAGAQDTRFAAVISNDSGSTGAKLARSQGGEDVAAINGQFPYWFVDKYTSFNGNEDALPVDQHELLSLVAPRRVVVASATDDANANPEGEFLSYLGASRVYALYGIGNTGLTSTSFPPKTDTDFRGDAMSYHLRTGGHGLMGVDWDLYMKGNLFNRTAPKVAGGGVGVTGAQAPVATRPTTGVQTGVPAQTVRPPAASGAQFPVAAQVPGAVQAPVAGAGTTTRPARGRIIPSTQR